MISRLFLIPHHQIDLDFFQPCCSLLKVPGLPMGNPHSMIMSMAQQAVQEVLNLTGGP